MSSTPLSITVAPGSPTLAAQSTITLEKLSYISGEYIVFLIEARDQYGNLRPASIAETFDVELTSDTTSVVTALTYTSNNNGTYTVNYQLTTKDSYTLSV